MVGICNAKGKCKMSFYDFDIRECPRMIEEQKKWLATSTTTTTVAPTTTWTLEPKKKWNPVGRAEIRKIIGEVSRRIISKGISPLDQAYNNLMRTLLEEMFVPPKYSSRQR